MREKLGRRAERAEDVEGVLARLKDSQYLDDRQFAEGYASARLSNERFGKTRVLRDLRHRRVPNSLAEKTVRTVYQDVDEGALIEEWIRRKYRTADRETLFREEKDLASAYRRLVRAGFRTGEIVKALKKFANNPELSGWFRTSRGIRGVIGAGAASLAIAIRSWRRHIPPPPRPRSGGPG